MKCFHAGALHREFISWYAVTMFASRGTALSAQESHSVPAPAMAAYFGDSVAQASNLGISGVHLEEYDGESDLMKECRRDILEASRKQQEHMAHA
eukprot:15215360-Alexandrium_andersonii.AAC.1